MEFVIKSHRIAIAQEATLIGGTFSAAKPITAGGQKRTADNSSLGQIFTTMLPLFNIQDVFDISDRGFALVPGIPYTLRLNVKVGPPVLVGPPEGVRLQSKIAA